MNQSQSQGSPAPRPNAAVPTTVPNQDCTDAIAKIDQGLIISERYVNASGTQPTIHNIQAVLAILAESLSHDCKERKNPLNDTSTTRKPAAIGLRVTECSNCERQLYSIVESLQQIISMTQAGKDRASSGVGSAMNMSATIVSTTTMMSTPSLGLSVTTPTLAVPSVTTPTVGVPSVYTPTMMGLPVTQVYAG